MQFAVLLTPAILIPIYFIARRPNLDDIDFNDYELGPYPEEDAE
jgi:hypothetical protein